MRNPFILKGMETTMIENAPAIRRAMRFVCEDIPTIDSSLIPSAKGNRSFRWLMFETLLANQGIDATILAATVNWHCIARINGQRLAVDFDPKVSGVNIEILEEG